MATTTTTTIKKERIESPTTQPPHTPKQPVLIELSSSDSDSDADEGGIRLKRGSGGLGFDKGGGVKKRRKEDSLPFGFLDPLLPEAAAMPAPLIETETTYVVVVKGNKQFWKAGDYERGPAADSVAALPAVGMDHVRVHPKFLHSNATSHKWALGALAELLDNSLDEVCHGATFVNIDLVHNRKDGSKMLLVEDDGGGMDPDKLRQCMSLGYSAKSKIAATIGQYGNGFKTSTMRLGADVIVFSRSRGKDGRSPTQSIGMLSYTFLTNTGKEDIVVPMIDYEKRGQNWHKMMRSSVDLNTNLETILRWSPYSSEADLLLQFNAMSDQGTRIVIYNLWEDDQGDLELDFDSDKHDIQVRGGNRDERKIQMAQQFPNSRHFLTYRHSLRSYASILYLRLPRVFRMILRGKEIVHHNLVNDMMLKQEVTYKPQPGADGVPKDPNMVAVVTIGFVKDAKDHIDIQGFSVYHKNRLIKPFWRVWNAAGSDGRGAIGVLEANFVEPAHDKQDFERTTVLSRLETRLVQMQKSYWSKNCHKIGYAPRCNKKLIQSEDRESSPESPSIPSSKRFGKDAYQVNKTGTSPIGSAKAKNYESGTLLGSRENRMKGTEKFEKGMRSQQSGFHAPANDGSDSDIEYVPVKKYVNESSGSKVSPQKSFKKESGRPSMSSSPFSKGSPGADRIATRSQAKSSPVMCNGVEPCIEESELTVKRLKEENEELKERIKKMEESMLCELQIERDRNKLLVEKIQAQQKKLEEASKEQEALIDIFSEERIRRDSEEESLRKKLKDASVTIQELLQKLPSC